MSLTLRVPTCCLLTVRDSHRLIEDSLGEWSMHAAQKPLLAAAPIMAHGSADWLVAAAK